MPEEYFLTLVGPRVAPAARPWASGLPLEDGHTLPFIVDRGWVGPAGTYIEQWSIRSGGAVLYLHPARYIEVRGFQAVRRFSDTVQVPLRLEPGIYDIVFVVEDYRMGSFAVEVGHLSEHAEAPPAAEPAPAPAPVAKPAAAAAAPAAKPAAAAAPAAAAKPAAAAAPAAPAAPAAAYTGEDPAAVRKRVYEEELAKGSDPRVAEARSKSAEIKARKAKAATGAPAPAPAAPPAPAPPPKPGAPAAEAASASSAPPAAAAGPLLPDAPPGGGGMTADEAASVRAMVLQQEIDRGTAGPVAEALAKAAEIRSQRGVWWRPDW